PHAAGRQKGTAAGNHSLTVVALIGAPSVSERAFAGTGSCGHGTTSYSAHTLIGTQWSAGAICRPALLRRRGLQQHQPGREFLAEDSAQGAFVLFLAIEYGQQAIG